MEILKDGIGRGYTAGIDSNNRILTFSTIRSSIGWISETKGTAFAACVATDSVQAGVERPIFYAKYTGDGSLHVDRLIYSTNTVDVSGSAFRLTANPTFVSGGTIQEPVNLNLSSGRSSFLELYNNDANDLDITATTDKTILCARLSKENKTFILPLDGALILRKNQTFAVFGTAYSVGIETRVGLEFYEEED